MSDLKGHGSSFKVLFREQHKQEIGPMTAFKLIAKLLKFEGFRCTGLAIRRGWRLDVLVKPYKVDESSES
jgi:hypothetical protein